MNPAEFLNDHVEVSTERTCAHCGLPQRGDAMVGDDHVCYTRGPYPDCYRLVTVYGEQLGSRNVAAQLAVVEQQIADHVSMRVQADRECIAEAIGRMNLYLNADDNWPRSAAAVASEAADIARKGGVSS